MHVSDENHIRYVVTGGDLVVVVDDKNSVALQVEAMVGMNLDAEVHVMSARKWEQVRAELTISNPEITITDLTHR